jgi:hypothetical protein
MELVAIKIRSFRGHKTVILHHQRRKIRTNILIAAFMEMREQ